MGVAGKIIAAAVEEAAEQLASQEPLKPPDPLRWIKRGIGFGILLLGWLFILWTNRFHVTAPTIFVCIGFLAVELAIWNLFRTGAQAASADEEQDDSTWGRPLGARGELEREKKTLLKAIKEAEFDHEMGKLSKVDADEMIGIYRARAIEVIKELDRLGGTAGTVREQIEREVKARLEVLARTTKAAADRAEKATVDKQDGKAKKKKDKKAPAKAATEAAPAKDLETATAGAADDATTDKASAAAAEPKAAEPKDAEAKDAEAKDAEADAKEAADDANAAMASTDSTDHPAKEATS